MNRVAAAVLKAGKIELEKVMDTRAPQPPSLFDGLTSFSDEINRCIIRSEIEGGVRLEDLPEGAALEVETENRSYRVVVRGGGRAHISGHPVFCPEPVLVNIHGSSWGGSMLKVAFIGRGMHLEFHHPEFRTITTSRIVEIRTLH